MDEWQHSVPGVCMINNICKNNAAR
ncbi:MAG: hypothetical protein OEY29_08780 [Gammaproteobacteria bacterium]|nr:hypothetical protein [Gammaproteobacteria bacterium]